MPRKTRLRKRNPNQFTTDEIRTADLIMTEGSLGCAKYDKYRYPTITIAMCDRPALEPAARVFKRKINPDKRKTVQCPAELFPPEGKGYWRAIKEGKGAEQIMQRLDPLLSPYTRKKWQKILQTCK